MVFGPATQDWSSANSVARALSIGKAEASAFMNIMSGVPESIVNRLEDAVRSRGMLRFINHDVIGQKVMNLGFSSGIHALESWREELRRKDDLSLVSWMQCTRKTNSLKFACQVIIPFNT